MRRSLLALTLTPLLLVAACGGDSFDKNSGGDDAKAVTVVGQGFTEADLMTQLYKLVLEKEGYQVSVKNFKTRDIYLKALEAGEVQVAADYLSSLTEELNRRANGDDAKPVAEPDPTATLATLTDLAEKNGLTPLEPAKAEDANAYAVTKRFAKKNNLSTLSDLGRLGKPVALAANSDCPERADCQLGLEKVYGIKISKFEPLGFGSAETKNALIKNEVQLGQVGTTDATLANKALVILTDDKDWQNAENLVPVVNTEWLKKHEDVTAALDTLSQTLTTEDLTELIGKVDLERELPATVAKDYLTSKGLL